MPYDLFCMRRSNILSEYIRGLIGYQEAESRLILCHIEYAASRSGRR